MNSPRELGEIMQNARRLVQAKGAGALEYANKMALKMEETGDENDQAFWERIASQIELLLDETPID